MASPNRIGLALKPARVEWAVHNAVRLKQQATNGVTPRRDGDSFTREDAMHDDLRCVREWKRDGTRHRMSLANAAHVASSNPPEGEPRLAVEEAARRLRGGERLETPLSYLYTEGTR
jgi:hypothetical protein